MNNFSELGELEDAIVRYIQGKRTTKEKIINSFVGGPYRSGAVNQVITALERRGYVKLSDKKYHKSGIYFLDAPHNEDDWEHVYLITPLGKAYLARSSANFTSYSNISNSNIAHQSPNSKQSIEITELPEELQQKILEFDEAAKQKDGAALKKAFGYIADKSVDVAIALATGVILR